MATITLVRHGNTAWNVEKRAQGHMHNPLNERGRRQATAVAKRLANHEWDILISSDLLRARETAETVSAAIQMPITEFDRRIREIDRGQLSGTILEERIAKWGEHWRELDLGEESNEAVRERGLDFIQDIAVRYAGKKVLVISHGLLITETLKGLFPDGSIGNHIDNTSLCTVRKNGETWELLKFNCTEHLEGVEI